MKFRDPFDVDNPNLVVLLLLSYALLAVFSMVVWVLFCMWVTGGGVFFWPIVISPFVYVVVKHGVYYE